MPYRVESKGVTLLALSGIDASEDVRIERLYRKLGYVGVALAVVGTALQIAGVIYA
jgi:hypothetical protein